MAPHVQEHPSCNPRDDFHKIPIIDLSTLNSSQVEERQKLAEEIYDACTRVGFFLRQGRVMMQLFFPFLQK